LKPSSTGKPPPLTADPAADLRHIRAALALGRRNLGRTWPNPSVGCVIVRDGKVTGRGWTGAGGRPHAETTALERAGAAARRATAYLSLEPCNHHGKTPPCVAALRQAGVTRVVMAMTDPDPRVAGKGLAALREAGITVETGVGRDGALWLNAGHCLRHLAGRPFVTLKSATSLDGRIAAANGASQWISAPESRRLGHLLRARHDAILVGAATALADDPRLDSRHPGEQGGHPVRIVLDSRLRLPPDSQLARSARATPLWVFCGDGADPERQHLLEQQGARVFRAAADGEKGGLCPGDVLRQLAETGITRLLIEGGGQVAAAFLRDGLVDQLVWFRAAALMGGDGLPAVGPCGVTGPDNMLRFTLEDSIRTGPDQVDYYSNPASLAFLENCL